MNTIHPAQRLPVVVDRPTAVQWQGEPPERPDTAKIFFSDIVAAILRRWRLAVLAALVTGSVVLLAGSALTPRYTSTASVMLDTRRQQTVTNVQDVLSGLPADSFVVDSEVEVLQSAAVAQEVIARLGLDRDPEFNPSLRPVTFLDMAKDRISAVAHKWMTAIGFPPPAETAAPPAPATSPNLVTLAIFRSHLSVSRLGLTYVIAITFSSEDGEKSARIANAIADAYFAQQVDLKSRASQDANTFLEKRVNELRTELEGAERAVADYKAKNDLLGAVGPDLTQQNIAALTNELASARAAQAEQDGKLSAALEQSRQGGAASVGEAVSSDTVRGLRQQQAEVLRKAADLETRYGPLHPEVIKVRREGADLNRAVSAEIDRIIGSLRAASSAARERTASLESSIAAERRVLSTNNAAMVELAELQRNADAVRQLYESFLNRFKEVSSQAGTQQADAQIVSRAMRPLSPAYPPWTLIQAAAGLLAFLAAGLAIILAEMMDKSLRSAEDVERESGLPVFAVIPQVKHREPHAYVVEKPLSHYAEALRHLETAIFFSQPASNPKVVAIMSAVPGEGKTTCALSLARLSAMSGARVAIVDADLRRRTLTKELKLVSKFGLMEAVSHEKPVEECLYKDPLSPVMVLPVSDGIPVNKDIFVARNMEHVFARLRTMFDIVIVDTSPIFPVAEPRLVARHADAAILLARWRWTARSLVSDALRAARAIGVPVIGMAMTRADSGRVMTGYAGRSHNRSLYTDYIVE